MRNWIAAAFIVFAGVPHSFADSPQTSGVKQFPTAVMSLLYVGPNYIFANERKFAVTNNTAVISITGVRSSLRQLSLGQTISIEYHKEQKGFVADSITVVGQAER